MAEAKSPLLRRFILLLIFFILYTLSGALLFIKVEECARSQQENPEHQKFLKHLNITKELNQTEREMMKNISHAVFNKKTECSYKTETITKWWDFTIVSCVTVGKVPFKKVHLKRIVKQ